MGRQQPAGKRPVATDRKWPLTGADTRQTKIGMPLADSKDKAAHYLFSELPPMLFADWAVCFC